MRAALPRGKGVSLKWSTDTVAAVRQLHDPWIVAPQTADKNGHGGLKCGFGCSGDQLFLPACL